MGLRGPPPTPTAILRARGSWRAKEPGRAGEPTPRRAKPRAPEWLPEEARGAWREVGNLLDELGVITTADRNALIRYCVTWKRWRYAVEWVMQNGEFVDGEHGPKLHPMARIASTTAEELHKLEREFGMTPAARPRIGVGSAESAKTAKSKLQEWRDGGPPPEDPRL